LNYKRIPYKTVWIHYADVQSAMKAIGAEPNVAKVVNGTPRYTLPTIFDPNTSNFITESFEIAKYLDQQYPERPVVPYGSEQELSTFAETFLPNYGMASVPYLGQTHVADNFDTIGSIENRRIWLIQQSGFARSSISRKRRACV
jgi:glutathione S-transferase